MCDMSIVCCHLNTQPLEGGQLDRPRQDLLRLRRQLQGNTLRDSTGVFFITKPVTFEVTLKELKGEEGGCLNGRHPKLNSHCWNDIKLAAGKKPDLAKVKDL